jgi:5,10-methylenetetrahydromethanopterin reductase
MKFGLCIGDKSVKETIKTAKLAEQYGLDGIWLVDHSPAYGWRDIFVALGAIASQTNSINLGIGVTNPYTRPPGLIGVAMATAAELLDDRALVLGLGPGGSLPLKPLGIRRWDRPLTAISEAVQILRKLFSGEIVDFEGKLFKLKGTRLHKAFNIPIYLAARSPRMLKLAGEISDGVLLNPPLRLTSYAVELVKMGLKNAQKTDIDVVMTVPMMISESLDVAKRDVAILLPTTPSFALERLGLKEEAEKVVELMPNIQEASKLVTERLVREFVIIGSVDQCTKQISELEGAGINQLALIMYDVTEETVKIVAKDILPSFSKKVK